MTATTRRDFIKKLGALGLVIGVDGAPVLAAADDAMDLRDPDKPGTLDADERDVLWRLFATIGQVWNNAADCTLDRAGFEEVLDLKTSRAPSYLTEYREAVTRLRTLCRNGEETAVLQRLYFEKGEDRLRRFVLAEFIQLQMAYGGFRSLGYRNYKGYMGGMFSDPGRLPYRGREGT